ncbi:hypothetical protein [Streptomyces sp. NPDC060205]|uniref:hypothetical protein n=1 Tax=Streptomyces sp. NPDC060205 TaxID=3347072 RepID=UPI003661377C
MTPGAGVSGLTTTGSGTVGLGMSRSATADVDMSRCGTVGLGMPGACPARACVGGTAKRVRFSSYTRRSP